MLVAASEAGCRRIVLTGSLTEPLAVDGAANPALPLCRGEMGCLRLWPHVSRAFTARRSSSLRPFMTYGPGQAPSKLIPSVTLSLLRGERPKLSSGKARADWVYIADVIEGFVAAATAPGIEGETIDLGSGTPHPHERSRRAPGQNQSATTSSLISARCPTGRTRTRSPRTLLLAEKRSAGGRRHPWTTGSGKPWIGTGPRPRGLSAARPLPRLVVRPPKLVTSDFPEAATSSRLS